MSPLPRVFAYRDHEPTIDLARWKPHKVYCTLRADHADQPGVLFVVKFCQGRRGAAAMVSEVVCRALLSYGGLSVLEAFTVFASPNFSYSWNANSSCPFVLCCVCCNRLFSLHHNRDVYTRPSFFEFNYVAPLSDKLERSLKKKNIFHGPQANDHVSRGTLFAYFQFE